MPLEISTDILQIDLKYISVYFYRRLLVKAKRRR